MKKARDHLIRWRDCTGLLVVVLVAVFSPLKAVSADRFVVKPKVSGEWRVDSNYYKEESDESEVYTYLLRPGIELGYRTAKSLVALDYTTDFYFYDDRDDDKSPSKEEADGFVGHTLSFSSRTEPFDRLTAGLDNSYYETRDPSQTDTLSDRETREKYWINRLSPYFLYDFGPRFSVGARYRRTDVDYRGGESEDSLEHRGIFDLIYRFSRSASLDLEYQHWKMMYDTTSDYKSDQIALILRKQFNHLSFEAGGGYQKRHFEDSSLDDIDTYMYRGGIRWEKARTYATFTAEQNFNNYHDTGDYFRARRYSVGVGHLFRGRLPASIRGAYQNSDYEEVVEDDINKGRDDDTYEIAGSLGYIVTDWLTLTGEGGYEERDSNVDGYDYENEYFLFRVDLAYDVGNRKR